MSKQTAANRERQQYLKENGWNWRKIRPKKPKPKGLQYFRYGSISIMKPQISVYLE